MQTLVSVTLTYFVTQRELKDQIPGHTGYPSARATLRSHGYQSAQLLSTWLATLAQRVPPDVEIQEAPRGKAA